MSTHIGAKKGQIADVVLLPGDPLRAAWLAKKFLKAPETVHDVRGMPCYTGFRHCFRALPGQLACTKKLISIQSSGMGMPSLGIYVEELARDFGVKKIIRLGTCGALQEKINLRDIIIAMGACSDSASNIHRFGPAMSFAPIADPALYRDAVLQAEDRGLPFHTGNVFATDDFYDHSEPPRWQKFARYGALAVEMETAKLYTLAAYYGIQALSLLVVSDHLAREEKPLTSEERVTCCSDIAMIALSIVA
ncbi:purine-nucleoside phosphorylase [Candidatus Kuenenbacteria bacterium]|nr:purine-nucleoside phosphorylase [Candidatus Kuenenbacteria bacterium]